MRLAAQVKGGYYPASPEAIEHVLAKVKPMKGCSPVVFDPCCGEGLALRTVGKLLGSAPNRLYGVELENDRVKEAQANNRAAHILHCSFFEVGVTSGSFGLAWVNPPFDDVIGGSKRVELDFLENTTKMLYPGGIMAFVCPAEVSKNAGVRYHFLSSYDNISVVPFPEGHNPFNEVVMLGERKLKLDGAMSSWHDWASTVKSDVKYVVPGGFRPRQFKRVRISEQEMKDGMWNSPLRKLMSVTEEQPVASPPLALSVTHYALLLAAGHLDGLVEPPGEPPHVVRGIVMKEEYTASESEDVNDNGDVVVSKTIQERVILTVRALWPTGKLETYTQKQGAENDAEE